MDSPKVMQVQLCSGISAARVLMPKNKTPVIDSTMITFFISFSKFAWLPDYEWMTGACL